LDADTPAEAPAETEGGDRSRETIRDLLPGGGALTPGDVERLLEDAEGAVPPSTGEPVY
jgi:hypothetical protein